MVATLTSQCHCLQISAERDLACPSPKTAPHAPSQSPRFIGHAWTWIVAAVISDVWIKPIRPVTAIALAPAQFGESAATGSKNSSLTYTSVMLPRTSSLNLEGVLMLPPKMSPRGTCATVEQSMLKFDGDGNVGGDTTPAWHKLSGNSGTPVAGSPQLMPHQDGAHGHAHGRAGSCAAPL